MTLYERLKAAGCELDSHVSDLYVRATPAALQILKEQRAPWGAFRSPIDGEIWCEVPFAYDPFWRAAAGRAEARLLA
jgi:hypothetical protein